MPYLKSAQVTGEPSCHLIPSRSVNVHVLAPSEDLPVSVAASGMMVLAFAPSVLIWYVVSDRVMYAAAKARSSPV